MISKNQSKKMTKTALTTRTMTSTRETATATFLTLFVAACSGDSDRALAAGQLGDIEVLLDRIEEQYQGVVRELQQRFGAEPPPDSLVASSPHEDAPCVLLVELNRTPRNP